MKQRGSASDRGKRYVDPLGFLLGSSTKKRLPPALNGKRVHEAPTGAERLAPRPERTSKQQCPSENSKRMSPYCCDDTSVYRSFIFIMIFIAS